jgi:hypothetical protein
VVAVVDEADAACAPGLEVQEVSVAKVSNAEAAIRAIRLVDMLSPWNRSGLSDLLCGDGPNDRNAKLAVAVGLIHQEKPKAEET